MAKYIIDIPDDRIGDFVGSKYLLIPYAIAGCKMHHVTEFDLTPYTEPDREAIENEVWSIAREIAYCMSLQECIDTGMLHDDDIYDSASGVLEKLTYQEAKVKYEAWRKQKDEIRVGDEVIIKSDDVKGVVLDEDSYGEFSVFTENGCCEAYRKIHFEKTGRHFPEVNELLKKMRDAE